MHCNALHCWWLTGTQLWLLSLRFSNTDRHLGFEQHPRTQQLKPVTARRAYSSSEFKNIRAHQPKCRLQPQLWRKLQDLGLTKRYRSKRGGQPRIHGNPVLPLTGIPLPPALSRNGSNHSSVRPFAKNVIPTTMVANVQSLVPKLDELLAVLEVYSAEFVCLTETWLNESCPDSLVHLPGYLCFRNDLQNRVEAGSVHTSNHCSHASVCLISRNQTLSLYGYSSVPTDCPDVLRAFWLEQCTILHLMVI